MAAPASDAAVGGLPDQLVRKDGTTVATAEALGRAEYVGLYFSAHGFTPVLSDWFAKNHAKANMEIVFVSSDNEYAPNSAAPTWYPFKHVVFTVFGRCSEAAFNSYFKEMSWNLAVPYTSPIRKQLGSKYKVQGIPTFVIINKAGDIVCSNGRQKVSEDPEAKSFPWKPKGVWEVLADAGSFVDKSGKSVDVEYLKGLDAIGLYFSAHWCPPCRGFTPELAKWYTTQTAAGGKLHGKLDVVFVSSDRDEKSFNEYLGEMPWKALPYAQRTAKAELTELYDVEGIPTLVFIDKEGKVITKDGRAKVSGSPDGFPWPPQPVSSIDEAVGDINEVATLILFTDAATDAVNEVAAVEALNEVAREYFKDGKVSDRIRFAIASGDAGATVQIRKFLGKSHQADKDGPTNIRATIVDIPNGVKASFNGGALKVPSKEELSAFVASYLAGSAETTDLRA